MSSNQHLDQVTFNQGLLEFIRQSPTPFHAVATMAAKLEQNDFQRLHCEDKWQLRAGHRYFVTRNDSSVIGFIYGKQDLLQTGLRLVGAHTDSPCLRVKPRPNLHEKGYFQLGVEVYGSVLLNPWFDRDLSLAGRVTFSTKDGVLKNALINFEKPIAIIPSLAIHLDREVNDGRKINAQRDIPPVLLTLKDGEQIHFLDCLNDQLSKQHPQEAVDNILDYELSFYDVQSPALVGLRDEFIASARLDNLASCYIGLQALLNANGDVSSLLICNDHEEVGSQSTSGASGPFLNDFLDRLLPDAEFRQRVLEKSMLISADNAHGIHPNFADKHDANHGPILNRGPVIKVNNNQRYATNSETAAVFRWICNDGQLPVQTFVSRTDMACGSTIGPLTATQVGVRTLDVGIPTFAMHSIRELAGADDAFVLFRALSRFQAIGQLR